MYPFALAAGAIALYFILTALPRPRPAQILAVILWGAYAVYEYYVANGTLCDPNCNIRVDLVLFIPLLGCATYLATRKEPRTGAVVILIVICLGMAAFIAMALGYTAVAVIAGSAALIVAALGIRSKLSNHRA